jgi:DNA-binding Lrp family transcriptional regulator
MLSRKDRAILAELQADSRLTMQQLAEKVGMSSSACWRRVKSLEESGVIDRYVVIVNPGKAGFSLSSMTLVSLARHEERSVENFVKEVRRHPEVLECFATSGEGHRGLQQVSRRFYLSYPRRIPGSIEHRPEGNQNRHRTAIKEINAVRPQFK